MAMVPGRGYVNDRQLREEEELASHLEPLMQALERSQTVIATLVHIAGGRANLSTELMTRIVNDYDLHSELPEGEELISFYLTKKVQPTE